MCTGPEDKVKVIAYGRGNKPIIVLRDVGDGKVVVIGDTGFAMNKNLERKDGRPFEGMRENADFWRWFITRLTDRPQWIPRRDEPPRPPKPPPPPPTRPATRPVTRPAPQSQPSKEATP